MSSLHRAVLGKVFTYTAPSGWEKVGLPAAMAQDLVRFGVDSLMVYVPEFIREVKDSFVTAGVQQKLDALKKATVLILDDIGAENYDTLDPGRNSGGDFAVPDDGKIADGDYFQSGFGRTGRPFGPLR